MNNNTFNVPNTNVCFVTSAKTKNKNIYNTLLFIYYTIRFIIESFQQLHYYLNLINWISSLGDWSALIYYYHYQLLLSHCRTQVSLPFCHSFCRVFLGQSFLKATSSSHHLLLGLPQRPLSFALSINTIILH